LSEVESLFAEGRLTVGRTIARTGLDAARAIARLGVSRGIGAFERYMLIQPDAKMPYQATPLGRFCTPDRPRRDLVADLDAGNWLAKIRRLSREKAAAARVRIAVRGFEDSLFDLTREDRERGGAQAVFAALGGVVSWLSTNSDAREKLTPPPRLGHDWSRIADDGSAEFRVAAALASVGWPHDDGRSDREEQETAQDTIESDIAETTSSGEQSEAVARVERNQAGQFKRVPRPPAMAAHFAPVDEDSVTRRFRRWTENNAAAVVWGAGSLVQNMIAVLERRLIEQAMRGLTDKALAGSALARLSDVMAFLDGPPAFDDARCAALLSGLVWARPVPLYARGDSPPVPFAYAALKPLFTPDAVLRQMLILSEGGRLPIPSGLVAWLRRGSVEQAVGAALSRTQASGIGSAFSQLNNAAMVMRFGTEISAVRLAASLLIPIDTEGLRELIARIYPEKLGKGGENRCSLIFQH
jgi:CRISPR-associated protein Csx17